MGFTTGLLGGITLTSSLLYFSLAIHTSNRNHQRTLLRQQNQVLLSFVEPQPVQPLPPVREERSTLSETAKDRWNGEIIALVRRLQTTDWIAVREDWERRAISMVEKIKGQ